MYEAILGKVAQGISGQGGGGSAVPSSTGARSGSGIYVAPVGINLGAILQTMNEGNPETGGYGVDLISRLGYGAGGQHISPYLADSTPTRADGTVVGGFPLWLLIAAGGGVLLLFVMKRKGG